MLKIGFISLLMFIRSKSSYQLPTYYSQKEKKNSYPHLIISALDNIFGYDILSKGKVFSCQIAISVLSGKKEFVTKATEMAIEKMKNGEFPPCLKEAEFKLILNNKK